MPVTTTFWFMSIPAAHILEKQRYHLPFGLLMLDIDHVKPVNDRYGHDAGDRVLQTLAGTMLQSAGPHDLYGRWGGEEFIGLIRSADQSALEVVSERLGTLVAGTLHQAKRRHPSRDRLHRCNHGQARRQP